MLISYLAHHQVQIHDLHLEKLAAFLRQPFQKSGLIHIINANFQKHYKNIGR